LVSRKRNVYRSFAQLKKALSHLPVRRAILDGEIVCLDGDGRSQFLELMRRRRTGVVFYAFDLLWHYGEDLRGLPLIERKRKLQRLIRTSQIPTLLYADHITSAGVRFFKAVCQRDCEGIVAKHRLGPYRAAPSTWFKILNPAYSQKRGRCEMFDSPRERRSAERNPVDMSAKAK
jgi:bifunctional non-homologous end joining protein LigD